MLKTAFLFVPIKQYEFNTNNFLPVDLAKPGSTNQVLNRWSAGPGCPMGYRL